jgi:hypothetical protein
MGVKLDDAEEVECYIDQLIGEFEEKPEDVKFSSTIHPPLPPTGSSKAKYFFPTIFLWSPQEHFKLKLKCPIHCCHLRPSRWTKAVSGNMAHNARLIYDLHGNVILVQRIYQCDGNSGNPHELRSTSTDIHQSLPSEIQLFFPVELFHRSGCTKHLMQYVDTQILQGVNFLQISEGLASLNLHEFQRQRNIYFAAVRERNQPLYI